MASININNIISTITEIISELQNLDKGEIDIQEPFAEFGIDSMTGLSLIEKLNNIFELEIHGTALFVYSTPNKFAIHIKGLLDDKINNSSKNKISKQKELNTKEDVLDPSTTLETDIAIIGMSGHFPKSPDINTFWKNLISGKDCTSDVPTERWDYASCYSPGEQKQGKTYTKRGGFLDDVFNFDNLFFNISPKEALFVDPQQRVFLEEGYKALEDAGYINDYDKKLNCGDFH